MPRQNFDECRFARAAPADEGDELSRRNGQIELRSQPASHVQFCEFQADTGDRGEGHELPIDGAEAPCERPDLEEIAPAQFHRDNAPPIHKRPVAPPTGQASSGLNPPWTASDP